MTWLVPSVIAVMAGTILLVFIFYYLYLQDREKYLIIWTSGWLACLFI